VKVEEGWLFFWMGVVTFMKEGKRRRSGVEDGIAKKSFFGI